MYLQYVHQVVTLLLVQIHKQLNVALLVLQKNIKLLIVPLVHGVKPVRISHVLHVLLLVGQEQKRLQHVQHPIIEYVQPVVLVNTVQTVAHVKPIQPVARPVNINRQMVLLRLISHVVHVLMLVELEQKRLQHVRLTQIGCVQPVVLVNTVQMAVPVKTIPPVVLGPHTNRLTEPLHRISRVPIVKIVEQEKKNWAHVVVMMGQPIEHVKIVPLVNTVRTMEPVKTIQPLVPLVNTKQLMEPLQLISRVPIVPRVLTAQTTKPRHVQPVAIECVLFVHLVEPTNMHREGVRMVKIRHVATVPHALNISIYPQHAQEVPTLYVPPVLRQHVLETIRPAPIAMVLCHRKPQIPVLVIVPAALPTTVMVAVV
jgi:hypothetical protein